MNYRLISHSLKRLANELDKLEDFDKISRNFLNKKPAEDFSPFYKSGEDSISSFYLKSKMDSKYKETVTIWKPNGSVQENTVNITADFCVNKNTKETDYYTAGESIPMNDLKRIENAIKDAADICRDMAETL